MESTLAQTPISKRAVADPPLLVALRSLLLGLVLWIFTRPGTHLQFVTVAALAGFLVWKLVRRERIARTPLTLPIIAALGAATLATWTSIDRRLSVDGLLLVLMAVIGFLLASEVLARGRNVWLLPGAILLVASWFVTQGLWATISEYVGWWQMRVPEYPLFPIEYRLFDTGLHPNHLAALLNLALPFAIVRLVHSQHVAERVLWLVWLAAADVVLFFTRSRGGWIATAAMLTVMLAWLLSRPGAPWRIGFRAWLQRTAAIWITAGSYLALFAGLFVLVTQSAASDYSTSGGSVASGAGRTLFWSIAWHDFLRDPLTGSGPQTYAYLFMDAVPTIRVWLAAHAHNLYIDTLAQQGLIGGLALLWIIVTGVWVMARAVRRAQPTARPLLIGACAALLGVLCHSLFDVVTTLPANALLVALTAAIGMGAAGRISRPDRGLSRWSVVALVAPLLLGLVVLRIDSGSTAQQRAVDAAEREDWSAAVDALDESLAFDPAMRVYRSQRAFAYGQRALSLNRPIDRDLAVQALAEYDMVLSSGPDYVPHLLNAAFLADATGDAAKADRLLVRAAALQSDWALPALLLADRYAVRGKAAEADALFGRAFTTEPQGRKMLACQRSAACRVAATRPSASTDDVADAHVEGQRLLKEGRAVEALAIFDRVPISLATPLPWIDRADAHLALDQLPQARYALRMASLLGADGPATSAHMALTRAAYHTARGAADDALVALEYPVRSQGGGRPYDFFVYGRGSLPAELLPQLDMLNRTVDHLDVYRALEQVYRARGQQQDAAWAAAQISAFGEIQAAP